MATNNSRLSLAVAALIALVPLAADATLSRAVSFEEKVGNAAAIVVGSCVAQESRWDQAHKWILTYSRFRVEKALKGQPVAEMTIVTPGGSVGEIHQETIGVPKFREGEDVVLFVRNTKAGPTVLYFEQGAYRIVKEGSERMVVPATSAAVLIDTQRGMAVTPESPRTLRDFERVVRETVRRNESVQMELLERRKQEASFWRTLQRNKALVALALIGAALATWQLVKRW
jgi:hypothetical protein